jgi:hypothetical protein
MDARNYRDRWSILGAVVGMIVIFVGMALTPESRNLAGGWYLAGIICAFIGLLIGQFIYRRKSEW